MRGHGGRIVVVALVASGLIGWLAGCEAEDAEPSPADSSRTADQKVTPTPVETSEAPRAPQPTTAEAPAATTPAPPPPPATTEPPPPVEPAVGTDPQFGTCKEAKANGYGPYVRGQDPEYDWYRDADSDGIVCE